MNNNMAASDKSDRAFVNEAASASSPQAASIPSAGKMPWHTDAALKQVYALMKAANDLCFAAETACGTAARDNFLCAAIAHYAATRDRVTQMARIIRFEWDEPEISAGRAHPLAKAIEARSDETSGSVEDESAARQGSPESADHE